MEIETEWTGGTELHHKNALSENTAYNKNSP